MMHPFMTYPDGTEITRSDLERGGRVLVRLETPDEADFFHSVDVWLPGYEVEESVGFNDEGLRLAMAEVAKLAPAILNLARSETKVYPSGLSPTSDRPLVGRG